MEGEDRWVHGGEGIGRGVGVNSEKIILGNISIRKNYLLEIIEARATDIAAIQRACMRKIWYCVYS